MTKLIFALITAIAPMAFAETLTCSFTEPFFTLNYDTETQVLTRSEYDDNGEVTTVVGKNVRVTPLSYKKVDELASYARYALIGKDGKVYLRMTLNYQGSDGMSNITFPYDVNIPNFNGANSGYGGCESGSLKAFNPDADENGDSPGDN